MNTKLRNILNSIPDVILVLIPFALGAVFITNDKFGEYLGPWYRFALIFSFSIAAFIMRIVLIYFRISPIRSIVSTIAFGIILSVLGPLIHLKKKEVLLGAAIASLVVVLLIYVLIDKRLDRFKKYLKPLKNPEQIKKVKSEDKHNFENVIGDKEEWIKVLEKHHQNKEARKKYKQKQKLNKLQNLKKKKAPSEVLDKEKNKD